MYETCITMKNARQYELKKLAPQSNVKVEKFEQVRIYEIYTALCHTRHYLLK